MERNDLIKAKLPDLPGVYIFCGEKGEILYIGKATSLRSRVRSYFSDDLMKTRGKRLVDMVTIARTVKHITTDSVLEALILEASLIKKHQPKYNIDEKDDKSWNYVIITNEEFPIVTTIRERSLLLDRREQGGEFLFAFGPFTESTNLREALKIIRRIFPYRDERCKVGKGIPCFNRQIHLCPGTCTGEISKSEYRKRIREIALFFSGKKQTLLRDLNRDMQQLAKKQEFEKAKELRDTIFALSHIRDVSLIKEEVKDVSQATSRSRRKSFRIEAFDVAHISGKFTVGVMVVVEDGYSKHSEYRRFKIKEDNERPNDTKHLAEILRRRFSHLEWTKPDLIVVDGGTAQKRRAERTMNEINISVPVVSVCKNEHHKPKSILGEKELVDSFKRGILIANAESHRFAVKYHRELRGKIRPQ